MIVATSPQGYREIRCAQVFTKEDRTFTAPMLTNGRIYCRSYAGEVVCLRTAAP